MLDPDLVYVVHKGRITLFGMTPHKADGTERKAEKFKVHLAALLDVELGYINKNGDAKDQPFEGIWYDTRGKWRLAPNAKATLIVDRKKIEVVVSDYMKLFEPSDLIGEDEGDEEVVVVRKDETVEELEGEVAEEVPPVAEPDWPVFTPWPGAAATTLKESEWCYIELGKLQGEMMRIMHHNVVAMVERMDRILEGLG